MKPLIEAENSRGDKIMVDPNEVILNAAGTNMSIATYPDRELNRGNRKPIYESYKTIRFNPLDKEGIDTLFNLKVSEQEAAKKRRDLGISLSKKNTPRQILA